MYFVPSNFCLNWSEFLFPSLMAGVVPLGLCNFSVVAFLFSVYRDISADYGGLFSAYRDVSATPDDLSPAS